MQKQHGIAVICEQFLPGVLHQEGMPIVNWIPQLEDESCIRSCNHSRIHSRHFAEMRKRTFVFNRLPQFCRRLSEFIQPVVVLDPFQHLQGRDWGFAY